MNGSTKSNIPHSPDSRDFRVKTDIAPDTVPERYPPHVSNVFRAHDEGRNLPGRPGCVRVT
jgi:hypothetical protein